MVPNYPSAGSAQPDYTLNGAGYPQHGFWGGASMYDAGASFAVNRSPHLAQYSGSQYSSNSDLVYSPMAAQDGMGKSAFSYDGQPTWMSSASGMVPRGTGGTASDADTTYSTSPRSYSSEVLTLEIHPPASRVPHPMVSVHRRRKRRIRYWRSSSLPSLITLDSRAPTRICQ
jgi:hypothetical protein